MHDELRLVRGAVADKDLIPVLTHFHFYDGRIQGGNGELAIDSPIGVDGEFTVPAARFLKAVDACGGGPRLSLGDQVLTVSKGCFRARMPLAPHDSYPRQDLAGETIYSGPLLPAFRMLQPFIGTDAQHAWALGIIIQSGWAWATNNVVLARSPIAWKGPPVVIPVAAVQEMLRIGQEPMGVRVVPESRLCFELQGGAWLGVTLQAIQPPDLTAFSPQIEAQGATGYEATDALADAVALVLPFCPNVKFPVLHLDAKGVSTAGGEFSAEVEMPLPGDGWYHAEPLSQVLGKADWINLERYPAAVPWRGDGVEGLLVGMRK